MKDLLTQYWKPILIGAGIVVGLVVLFDFVSFLYGAGIGAVAWYSARQSKKIKVAHTEVKEASVEIEKDVETEIQRQVNADEALVASVKVARDGVRTGQWDDAEELPAPRLEK